MITDLILVAAGIVLFTFLAALQKPFSQIKTELPETISKSAVLSGTFVSILKFIILINELENNFIPDNGASAIQFSQFIILFFVRFRPMLFGLLVKLILLPFKRTKGSTLAKNETTGTMETDLPEKSKLLSPREKEVARLAARGYSNAQIADELFISVETVKRHMATIFEKLEIDSRFELDKYIL